MKVWQKILERKFYMYAYYKNYISNAEKIDFFDTCLGKGSDVKSRRRWHFFSGYFCRPFKIPCLHTIQSCANIGSETIFLHQLSWMQNILKSVNNQDYFLFTPLRWPKVVILSFSDIFLIDNGSCAISWVLLPIPLT